MPEPEARTEKTPESKSTVTPNTTVPQPDITEMTQEPTEEIEQIFRGKEILFAVLNEIER
jgi:hypothetical protein